ncbi:methyltransferase [Motiliproteus sp. MSK22-1]|uniref:methyltransferase n=1 Tax=Motiliproteus sp. MSK22-1 TaxID=1897630 RepID=UPI00097727E6|nr:methyltransferase [Motiliproteus sp. MSK22-1]OMH31800.1 hypothetical protein BGP75_16940 [Motiliproteus sp. MSK22-1]
MSSVEEILYQQLQQYLLDHRGDGLWVLDENLASFAPSSPMPALSLLTNRFDIYVEMNSNNWAVEYSDFDFSPWADKSLDRIYYRVSKEKPVVHHIINQAVRCLKEEGQLILLGAKNEGAKTYFDKARKLFGEGELIKAGKGAFVGIVTSSGGAQDELLDDKDYDQKRSIAEFEDQPLISKPGVFGWDKIDLGSAYLANNLDSVYGRLANPQPRVLDLGCGYGYLSLRTWTQGASEIIATDNNAAAVISCRENFQQWSVNGDVVADNCGLNLEGRFDLVVCNPPFHQGFSVDGGLTDRFLHSASKRLAVDGQAAFVVNRFIPLERKAKGVFAEIETFADNGSFKLVRLAKPIGR